MKRKLLLMLTLFNALNAAEWQTNSNSNSNDFQYLLDLDLSALPQPVNDSLNSQAFPSTLHLEEATEDLNSRSPFQDINPQDPALIATAVSLHNTAQIPQTLDPFYQPAFTQSSEQMTANEQSLLEKVDTLIKTSENRHLTNQPALATASTSMIQVPQTEHVINFDQLLPEDLDALTSLSLDQSICAATTTPMIQTQQINVNKSLECQTCFRIFATKENKDQHTKYHTGERSHLCTICGRSFKQKEKLTKHMITHTDERPFPCTIEGCDKRFKRKATLIRHIRTHSNVKPYQCDICNKRFREKGNLKKHQRTHTGEKTYECPIDGCGKRFKQKGNLKDHTRTHTGERPYLCTIKGCGKSFNRKATLTDHIRTHTGERPFLCPIDGCGKRFAQKRSLTVHIRTHTKDLTNN